MRNEQGPGDRCRQRRQPQGPCRCCPLQIIDHALASDAPFKIMLKKQPAAHRAAFIKQLVGSRRPSR
jgi:hypothetical protein